MNKKDVLDYFGSVKNVASALNVTVQYVYDWQEIIPENMASRIDKITRGQLRYDHEFYMSVKKGVGDG